MNDQKRQGKNPGQSMVDGVAIEHYMVKNEPSQHWLHVNIYHKKIEIANHTLT